MRHLEKEDSTFIRS